MGAEVIVVAILAFLLGGGLAYIFRESLVKKLNRAEKEKDKVINNPDLLVEKLNKNGKMVDVGEELKYSVIEENGVKKVALEKCKVQPTATPKPKKNNPKSNKAVKKSGPKKG